MEFFYIFGPSIVFCIFLISILSYFGMHIIRREAVFIDISVAQISAVGVILSHSFFHIEEDSLFFYLTPFLLVVFSSFFYALCKKYLKEISIEAVIGITYAVAAAFVLFWAGIQTGSHTHIEEIMNGSILWLEWEDVFAGSAVYIFILSIFLLFNRHFERITELYRKNDKEYSLKDLLWDFIFYLVLGVAIIYSVKKAGIILVFTLLIFPSTAGIVFGNSWKSSWLYSLFFGVASILPGLIFSDNFDFSVGPSIALSCVIISLLFINIRSLKNRRAKKD